MNNLALQPALREWRRHMAEPARVASLMGASVILALMGPFNTEDVMRFVPRLAYWGAIVVLCYSVGYFGNIIGEHLAGPRASLLRRAAFCVPLTAVGVLAVVYVMTGLAIGFWATGLELLLLSANVIVISAIITGVFLLVAHTTVGQADIPPALLDRIPFEKRAPLVSLSVEDRYLRIRTTKGDGALLSMTFGPDIPDIRANVAKIKEAGLLPRT